MLELSNTIDWTPVTRHDSLRAYERRWGLLCHVKSEEEPSILYSKRVDHTQGVSERCIFQKAMATALATQGMPTFEVTPTQVVEFKNFRFIGSS
jgi:hypothetical protein